MLPKNLRLHLFIWFWVILSFFVISAFLIMFASGYRFNFKAKIFEKTALILADSDPKGAQVYLNDKFKGKTPLRLAYLGRGLYRLKFKKEGYSDWEKTENIESGKFIKTEATLFLKIPLIEEITEQEIGARPALPPVYIGEETRKNLPENFYDAEWTPGEKKLLYRTDSEIWLYEPDKPADQNKKIIARFSKNLQKIALYSDFKHILFVTGNQLRVMEISGENDRELFNLPDSDFWVSGDEIFYRDNALFKKAKVR